MGLIATTIGLLGSRKLFTEVKNVYWMNSWKLTTKASQLTILSLLLTCLFSGTYSTTQLALLLFPFITHCTAFAFISIKLGRPILAVFYPIYNVFLCTILDFVVVIYSLFTWNVQVWGGVRTRMVSVKEKSLRSPVFEQLFKKVKQMSLNKDDDDDDELLGKSDLQKTLKHQFIISTKYKEKLASQEPKEHANHISTDLEMQKTSNFGTEVFDAINALGEESLPIQDELRLSLT